ncbi:uncharacterized protein PADG_07365 [Paracoccidioides brasiliensis Pb18]|uniref:D-arabinitol 2-dehydrogenase n=1 Tax=Paracoccidioides brasiliensis (strain Pb18) TaxID=502780 RepID=C1GJC9_PARBD|nr:uncharacterized protein PADG_07365 [Paracoccidioides brasiliensis Pb18]EEH42545.1 hypothetical protein PADG_07365 [Paracoccidioides brasiliensis Pb18]
MFNPSITGQAVHLSRHGSRSTAAAIRCTSRRSLARCISATPSLMDKGRDSSRNKRDDDDPFKKSSTAAAAGDTAHHEGIYARTDESVRVEYPEAHEMPRTPIVLGRGGIHFKRTLASFSLEGRVSVVTGGARGLGLVMGQALVTSGSELAIVDLNKEEADVQVQKLLAQHKEENPGIEVMPKITSHYADVANPDSVNACISNILATHNRIDNLVTSAGFTENFDAISYPYDRMKKLWGVNVDGSYLFAVGVAKHLLERKSPGSIVMIGSMSGSIVNVPQPQAPYNAAKAAVRHLAASLAVEWASANIRVNCISPGYMLTALTRKILDDNPDLNRQWTSLIPQGKMGVPEDLMGAVTFLLSDASKYITGADLRVDGGYTLT